MAMAGYRVQTRDHGGPWRTVRTWPGEEAAKEDARALAAQRHVIEGVQRHGAPLSIPTFPYVRLLHLAKIVLSFDLSREA